MFLFLYIGIGMLAFCIGIGLYNNLDLFFKDSMSTEELSKGSFRQHRNLEWYAKKLCVTPHYLSEICRRASGRSAGYFVDLFTLQEVARLLSDKRLSIAQIADELSFSSASYFTRYVKKHFGMSPKAFRKAGTL